MSIQIKSIAEMSELPIKVYELANQILPSIIVTTPQGDVEINMKKIVGGGLFSSGVLTEKGAMEIRKEILRLQYESKEYLYKEWLESNNK